MQTIVDAKRTKHHGRLAMGFAIGAAVIVAAALPVAQQPWPEARGFMPICYTAIGVFNAITALLLLSQFQQSRRSFVALIAAAYFYAAIVLLLQMAFSGLVAVGDDNLEMPARVWMFWQGGFSLLVGGALFSGGRALPMTLSRGLMRRWNAGIVAAPLALAIGVVWIAQKTWDPVTLSEYQHGQLITNPVAVTVWLVDAAVVVGLILKTRLRQRLDVWLAVAMLGMLSDVSLSFIAPAPFTIGWYLARAIHVTAAAIVLGALLWEVHLIYQDLARRTGRLREEAYRDALTGLFNRRFFDRQLALALKRAQRDDRPLTLMICDIDHFKVFNDTYGHLEGDRRLAEVARTLMGQITRRGQFAARYGGEEFAAVLPGLGPERAPKVAEEIRQAIQSLRGPAGRAHGPTVSIGVGCYVPKAATGNAEELIRAADSALYKAKEAGRNRVRMTTQIPLAEIEFRKKKLASLRQERV